MPAPGFDRVYTPRKTPFILDLIECFYVGGSTRDVSKSLLGDQTQVYGQMFVERTVPAGRTFPFPVVFIHGGLHTGVTWENTPDGREGWRPLFPRAGFEPVFLDQAWRG